MRVVPVLAVVAVLGAVVTAGLFARGDSDVRVSEPRVVADTALRITIWAKGKADSSPRRWMLRCKPVGGSHPSPVAACRALAANVEALEPVPATAICTEIYGGPQVAEVAGRVDGEAVRASFARTDGCQIDRWNRLRRLFPVRV